MNNGSLSRHFSTYSDNASEIERKKVHLLRDFRRSKTTTDMLKVFKEMEAIFDETEQEITGSCYALGVELLADEDPEKALPFAERALEIVDTGETKLSLKVAMCLELLGRVYGELGRLHDGLGCYRALGVLKSLKEDEYSRDVWSVLHKIQFGLYLNRLRDGRREEALDHRRKSLDIRESKLGEEPRALVFDYVDMAEQYVRLRKHKKALPICLKALDIHIKLASNETVVALVRRLLSWIYTGMRENDKAKEEKEVSEKVIKCGDSDSIDSKIHAAKVLIAAGYFAVYFNWRILYKRTCSSSYS